MVGYVMICYGVCDAVCSVSFSPLVKMIGRVRVFSVGAVINLVIIITLRYWMPHPDDFLVFFVMAALWGVSDAVWQTQINALYGVLFTDSSEAAFSNYRLWESLGYILGYVVTTYSCMMTKLYFNMCILASIRNEDGLWVDVLLRWSFGGGACSRGDRRQYMDHEQCYGYGYVSDLRRALSDCDK
ncbi:putative protein unc-93-like A isoform X1 [Penaeus vannamei]|uniref:UNC93-like protein n=1 Tax=Penaeus vannamei TaxID=6689 RepID=A0A423SCB0_PENVA|nr:putative protein unc-93-like A isoform X1 [Penaeus vannamei]